MLLTLPSEIIAQIFIFVEDVRGLLTVSKGVLTHLQKKSYFKDYIVDKLFECKKFLDINKPLYSYTKYVQIKNCQRYLRDVLDVRFNMFQVFEIEKCFGVIPFFGASDIDQKLLQYMFLPLLDIDDWLGTENIYEYCTPHTMHKSYLKGFLNKDFDILVNFVLKNYGNAPLGGNLHKFPSMNFTNSSTKTKLALFYFAVTQDPMSTKGWLYKLCYQSPFIKSDFL